MRPLERLLALPPLSRTARAAADWVDLEGSLVVASLAMIAPRARGRLLDVGCGDKPYEQLFVPYVTEYIGLEHESTYVATRSGQRGRADVLYDGERIPFDDASFDTVLNIQVLEHTPRPAELLAEMARVLRPDGRLILSAPFSFRLHEEPHDYFRYSPHGLRVLCERASLEIVEIFPRGNLWSLVGHKVNSYLGFRVARMGGFAQSLGKLGHEATQAQATRIWSLPLVVPAMMMVAMAARVLDRVLPDPTETLGYLIIARHRSH